MKFIHYIIALLVAALDLATKGMILARFQLREEPIEVIPGLFSLTYVRNTGVAFGYFRDVHSPYKPVVLSAIALLALVVIAFYGRQLGAGRRWLPWALAGVMGGILGNFVDRLYHQSVVDFLDVYWRQYHWPTFNIADSAITIGIAVLLLDSWQSK